MSKIYQQVALVTGAARGIGEATVERFVEEGINVVATDILPDIKYLLLRQLKLRSFRIANFGVVE